MVNFFRGGCRRRQPPLLPAEFEVGRSFCIGLAKNVENSKYRGRISPLTLALVRFCGVELVSSVTNDAIIVTTVDGDIYIGSAIAQHCPSTSKKLHKMLVKARMF